MQKIVYGMFPLDVSTDFFTAERKATYTSGYKYLGAPNGDYATLAGDSAGQFKLAVVMTPFSLPANAQINSLSFGIYTTSAGTLQISTTPTFLDGTIIGQYYANTGTNFFATTTAVPSLATVNGHLYMRMTFGGTSPRAVDAFVAYVDYTVPTAIRRRSPEGTWVNVTTKKRWDGNQWVNAEILPITLPISRQRDVRQFFPQIDAATDIAGIEAPTKPIEDEYGLRANALHVNYSSTGFDMTMATFTNPKLKPAYKVLLDNLAMYPVSWLNGMTPLDAMFLCDSVSSGGQAYGGVAMSGTGQAFMSLEGTGNPVYAGTVFAGADFVFHHELQHLFYYAYTTEFTAFEAEWTSWNAVPYAAIPYDGHTADRPQGHIRSYGSTNFKEDLADVHAAIMTTPFQEELAQLIAEDPIVAKKVKFLRSWLASKSTIMGHPRYYAAIHNLPRA